MSGPSAREIIARFRGHGSKISTDGTVPYWFGPLIPSGPKFLDRDVRRDMMLTSVQTLLGNLVIQ